MIATNKLRFVERKDFTDDAANPRTLKILQQWWAPFRTFSDGHGYQTVELEGGEWRDVPIEKETA